MRDFLKLLRKLVGRPVFFNDELSFKDNIVIKLIKDGKVIKEWEP